MYAFVLEWTPAVASRSGAPPLGVIFAAFMVAYMGGATAVSILLRSTSAGGAGFSAPLLLNYICAASLLSLLAAGSLLSAAGHLAERRPPGVAFAVFLALCCFEFCLGAYFPSIAAVKAKWIDEDVRATAYSLFRVPLNLLVVTILLLSHTSSTTFLVCSALLAIALAASFSVSRLVTSREAQTSLLANAANAGRGAFAVGGSRGCGVDECTPLSAGAPPVELHGACGSTRHAPLSSTC